jgi:DNA-binding response OmpR family regulator
MRKHILIVEDDAGIRNLLKMSLGAEGYLCECASDGCEAADLLENAASYDLVLLDIMLPGADGYELLSYIRPLNIPVIFVSAKGSVEERIAGLKMGADDYIVKPFQLGEVLARVEAVLRRNVGHTGAVTIGSVMIDTESRTVSKSGEPVALTGKEFDLLVMLVENPNVALYRQQLYEKVWDEPFTGNTRTLDSHVQRLRKKLEWEERIQTVFRIGYRLEV